MSDYPFRVMNALLASELLPAFLRMKLMRRAGFKIAKEACIWPGASFRSRKITIGSGVFINVGFFHDGYDQLDIEDNVRIGQFVRVLTATHEIGDHNQRALVEVVGRPVRLSRGAWIGSGVTILPGVTVGRGCVVAASSVVIKSTLENRLYAGNPAREIRMLQS